MTLQRLSNVIKIREYVVKNRYERYHVCSFFTFFTAKKQKKHLTNHQKNAAKPLKYITF